MSKRREAPDDDLRVVRRDSLLVLRLHDREVEVLQWVFADLARLIGEGSGTDVVTERLFPRDLSTRMQSALNSISDDSREQPGGRLSEPALLLRGSVARVDESNQETARAGRVQG